MGRPSIILQPSIDHGSAGNLQSAVKRTQNIKKLAHFYPELVPGVSLLPELTQISEIVNEVTSYHDPVTSTLLAFGNAMTESPKPVKKQSNLPNVPIIAVAGGSAREAVRLFRLEAEYLGWGSTEDVGLKIFKPTMEDQGWWSGNGSPIQQVCFGGVKGGRTSWLAVRYHAATTILQPFLRSNAVPLRPPSYGAYSAKTNFPPPSRLDPNPIITLPIQRTGGSPHADVCFNIWDNLQFAILDQQGYWSIWKIKPPSLTSRFWAVEAGPKGKLSKDIVDGAGMTATDSYGWGAISWVGDENTIAIAKRKSLSVFHIKEPPKRLIAPDLNLAKSSDWILDMKRSLSDDTHLFVATSTRIFWLLIAPFNDRQPEKRSGSGASILLSWRHFRDERDISLRMNVLNDEKTAMVILYSSLTNFSTIYTFGISKSYAGFPQSLSDPYILPLYTKDYNGRATIEQNDIHGEVNPIFDLDLQLIDYENGGGLIASGLGSVYQTGGVKFFQLSTLHNDMSLRQCLYVGLSAADPINVETPETQQVTKTPEPLARVVQDDFIVPDRYPIEDLENINLRPLFEPKGIEVFKTEPLPPDEDPRTLDFEWLGKYLRVPPSPSDLQGGPSPPGVPFEQCLDLIRSTILDKLAVCRSGVESMLEILDLNIAIHDVDVASSMLGDFLISIDDMSGSREDDDGAVVENRVYMSVLFEDLPYNDLQPHLENYKNNLLLQVYDNLMAAWIKPLPKAIPSRVRIAAERNVREIAAQICLASLGIRVSSNVIQNEDIDQQPNPKHDNALNLPLRRKSSFQKRSVQPEDELPEPSLSPLTSSQISKDAGFMPASQLPTQTLPTPEMTPSLRSRSSAASLKDSEDPASQRLRALASLAPQPSLPSAASNILHQWSLGADPAKFDWEASQQARDAENQSEEDDDTNTPKAKKRRRALKRLRRGKGNAVPFSSSQATAAAASSMDASQQPPTLHSGSYYQLPPPVVMDPQSSSQFVEGAGAGAAGTSQMELLGGRRLHRSSGRNVQAKRGKKKKPGF